MRSWIWIAGIIAGLGLSAMAQNWLDAQRRAWLSPALAPLLAPPLADEELYLSSGEMIKYASLGFDGLLADIYWIRTVHYFGKRVEEQRVKGEAVDLGRMPLLDPLLRITTELDGHHIAAYRFGAFFLQYTDPERAIDFARQGIRNNPAEWRLYQDLGFIYWRSGRYREAGEAYLNGSRVAGAPSWMEAMAATMLAKGGDRETAREMFQRLCENSDDRFILEICGDRPGPLK